MLWEQGDICSEPFHLFSPRCGGDSTGIGLYGAQCYTVAYMSYAFPLFPAPSFFFLYFFSYCTMGVARGKREGLSIFLLHLKLRR